MGKKYKNKLSRSDYKKLVDQIIKKLQRSNKVVSSSEINEENNNFTFSKRFMIYMMKKHYREEFGMKDVSFVENLNLVQLKNIFEECMRINFLVNIDYMNLSMEEGKELSIVNSSNDLREKIRLIAFRINQANDDAKAMMNSKKEDNEDVV